MFSSKVFYAIGGFDIAFALISAVVHQPQAFVFMGLAALMFWIGDKRYNEEKGDSNA